MSTLHKDFILKKTFQVGASIFLSRIFGLMREILQVHYMGKGIVSDAFRAAWMLPNALRQIFAEGALSAAMVPTIVALVKEHKREEINKLIALSFIVFEGVVLVVIALVCWKAEWVVQIVVPGFSGYSASLSARLLRLLMPFIFFISSSSLLAGVLQSVHHFFVPSFSQVLLNIVWISGFLIGIYRGLAVESFCLLVLFGGFLQLIWHVAVYYRLGFRFSWADEHTFTIFKKLMHKFLPSTIGASVMQLSLLVDTAFASYLPVGSVSLLSIAGGFLRIPLGVFAVAFSTILLPHFSRVRMYAPKRLSFYVLESAKLVFWVTLPATILLGFFAEKIFYTLFFSDRFSISDVAQAKLILSAFLLGLFFLSMNKILANVYYSLHQMWIPAGITIISTALNYGLNMLVVYRFQATGLAIATSISAAFQTILFVTILYAKFDFRLYHLDFLYFLYRYLIQLMITFSLFYLAYRGIVMSINLLPAYAAHLLTMTVGFWLWAVPLSGLVMIALYYTRSWFKVRLYFLK